MDKIVLKNYHTFKIHGFLWSTDLNIIQNRYVRNCGKQLNAS